MLNFIKCFERVLIKIKWDLFSESIGCKFLAL